MKYQSKPDWCLYAAIALAAAALFLHVGYWIAGPALLPLLLWAYPQSYELAEDELVIHDSLTRRRIPYSTIRRVELESGSVRIHYGGGSEIVLFPSDGETLSDALAQRAPRDRYVEFRLAPARGAPRQRTL